MLKTGTLLSWSQKLGLVMKIPSANPESMSVPLCLHTCLYACFATTTNWKNLHIQHDLKQVSLRVSFLTLSSYSGINVLFVLSLCIHHFEFHLCIICTVHFDRVSCLMLCGLPCMPVHAIVILLVNRHVYCIL